MPAAAVTRKLRALFGIIGRKGHVGGIASLVWKAGAQPLDCAGNCDTRVAEGQSEFQV